MWFVHLFNTLKCSGKTEIGLKQKERTITLRHEARPPTAETVKLKQITPFVFSGVNVAVLMGLTKHKYGEFRPYSPAPPAY